MTATDHLGDRVAALVDGQLDHASRERLLAHLAHCAPCRTEVDAQRRLKASLLELGGRPMAPSDELIARLLALPSQPLLAEPDRGPLPVSLPRGSRRPGSRRPGARRPAAGPGARRRRSAAAGALVALGLVSALALGQPAAEGPSVPVDPASDVFVADFVTTTTDLKQPAYARMVPSSPSGR